MKPSAEKVRFLLRRGNRRGALQALQVLRKSGNLSDSIFAATALGRLDIEQREAAIQYLTALYRNRVKAREGEAVDAASGLLRLDPSQADMVTPGIRGMVQKGSDGGNDLVNIALLHVLAIADPNQKQFAAAFLRPLLHNGNVTIKAKAARLLSEINSQYDVTALEIGILSLLNPNREASLAGFDLLTALSRRNASKVDAAILNHIGLRASVNKPVPQELSALIQSMVTEHTSNALVAVVTARDRRSLHKACERFDDFFLRERVNVEIYTAFLATRLAAVASREGDGQAAVDWLLSEMQTPLADRWALYRHGCAYAVGLCTPDEDRSVMVARLEQLRPQERRPHIHIALSMALEELNRRPVDDLVRVNCP